MSINVVAGRRLVRKGGVSLIAVLIGYRDKKKGQPRWRTHGRRQDPCATVLAQSTDRLPASFVEGTRESGLVRSHGAPVCLVPGHLKRYLYTRVRVQASYIRSTPSTYIR